MRRELKAMIRCPIEGCGFCAKTMSHLKIHVEKRHGLRTLSVCPFCGRECRPKNGLILHCTYHASKGSIEHAVLLYFIRSARNTQASRELRKKAYTALRSGSVVIPWPKLSELLLLKSGG
jgi:hypothetical protein